MWCWIWSCVFYDSHRPNCNWIQILMLLKVEFHHSIVSHKSWHVMITSAASTVCKRNHGVKAATVIMVLIVEGHTEQMEISDLWKLTLTDPVHKKCHCIFLFYVFIVPFLPKGKNSMLTRSPSCLSVCPFVCQLLNQCIEFCETR
jgi:hypothetical protein